MNNTIKPLLAVAIILIAAILVVGTFATTTTIATQSAFAYEKNKGDNNDGNGNGNTVTIQKNRQGATESGFDNIQEQESQNVICTHPGNNASCVSEGTVVVAGGGRASTIAACVACFINSGLIDTQINILLERAGEAVGLGPLTLEQLCALLENGTISVAVLTDILNGIPLVSPEKTTAIITCLTNAGTLSPGAGR